MRQDTPGPTEDADLNANPMRVVLIVAMPLLAPPVGASSAAACEVDPAQVRRALQGDAASAVVARLFEDPACERRLEHGIASGGPEWIDLAVALRPYTDAHWSEELTTAMSYAMQRAPTRVLPLIDGPFGTDLCVPIIWDEGDAASRRLARALRQSRRMYEGLQGTRHDANARRCLAVVAEDERALRQSGPSVTDACTPGRSKRVLHGPQPLVAELRHAVPTSADVLFPDGEFMLEDFSYVGRVDNGSHAWQLAHLTTVWGQACRATSRLLVFDDQRRYLGNFAGVPAPSSVAGARVEFEGADPVLFDGSTPPTQVRVDGEVHEFSPY